MTYRRVGMLRTAQNFRTHLAHIGATLPFDEEVVIGPNAPLAQPYRLADGFVIGNRFCILPMEGWDGTPDGRPTELTIRRWRRFGSSGAKLIWGGEAVAVRPDGRANPNQLVINPETAVDLAALREMLVATHRETFGRTDDLLIGLQLTHSGRFARPTGKQLEPVILYHHPILDYKFGVAADAPVMTDDEIAALVEGFVSAAELAQRAGFHFVDIKHCHGYLGHEFLSAFERPGPYGGSFENRTRFLREIVVGVRAEAPGLRIGVRLSAFDFIPFRAGPGGVGEPDSPGDEAYGYAFGGDGTGLGIDLREPLAFLDLLASLDIALICITGGSPYYNPHIQRPALFPPSDGYLPPEDPLVGVARQIAVTAELRRRLWCQVQDGARTSTDKLAESRENTSAPARVNPYPVRKLAFVGSAYSYLQEWLPNVAQATVRTGATDFVGLGRVVLAYPDIIADVLTGRPLQRKRICRTFSDCTTAPRNGLVSGCYPLDPFYKARPEYEQLEALKNMRRNR
jgi:NADPH2 dehydrogenase